MTKFTIKGKSTGKAPSAVVTDSHSTFQLKRSNCTKFFRRSVRLDPNYADILGEFVASRILKNMLPDTAAGLEFAPQVDLVAANSSLQEENKAANEINDFRITSKYFDNDKYEQIDLLKFVEKIGGNHSKGDTKILLSDNNGDNEINLNATYQLDMSQPGSSQSDNFQLPPAKKDFTLDKKSFYDTLAASMILGEHDLNPGNFFIMLPKSGGKAKFGRIDMGHAFNDLIKDFSGEHCPKSFHTQGRAVVRNMINGDTVNAFKNSKTKFLRYFGDGIIFEPEFADALDRIAATQSKTMTEAVDAAIGDLKTRFENDNKNKEQIIKSGKTLLHRMGASPLATANLNSLDNICNKLRQESKSFVATNCEEAKSVAAMLRLQTAIDQLLKEGEKASITKTHFTTLVEKDYYLVKSLRQNIEWMRTKQNAKPFVGTLAGYLSYRQHELQAAQQHTTIPKKNFKKPRDYSHMSMPQIFGSMLACTATVTAAAVLGPLAAIAGAIITALAVFSIKAYNISKNNELLNQNKKFYAKNVDLVDKKIDAIAVEEILQSKTMHLNFACAKQQNNKKSLTNNNQTPSLHNQVSIMASLHDKERQKLHNSENKKSSKKSQQLVH